MNSEVCLPRHYMSVPLKEIRFSAKAQIERLLNDEENNIIESDSGLMNNYYGLAELVGLSNEQMRLISSKQNPTSSLFKIWEESDEFEPKLGKLWEYLTELKRFDVLKACRKAVDKDVLAYQRRRELALNSYRPVQDNEVSSRDDHHVDETLIMTIGDVEYNAPQFYDAFVCYNYESERDTEFVNQLITKLEIERGLKLCVPRRDILPGAAEYIVDAALIKSRCRMMIIVLSNAYLESSACEFQVKVAQALSPCIQRKRMVPVLIESMVIPDVLRHMSLCDFTKTHLVKWFWERLAKSLKQPVDKCWGDDVGLRNSSQSDITDVEDTTSIISNDEQNDLDSLGISMVSSPPRFSPMNIIFNDISCNCPATQTVRDCQFDGRANNPANVQFDTVNNFVHYNVGRTVYDHNGLRPTELNNPESTNYRLQTRGSSTFGNLTNEIQRHQNNENDSSFRSFTSSIRDKFQDISSVIKKRRKSNVVCHQ